MSSVSRASDCDKTLLSVRLILSVVTLVVLPPVDVMAEIQPSLVADDDDTDESLTTTAPEPAATAHVEVEPGDVDIDEGLSFFVFLPLAQPPLREPLSRSSSRLFSRTAAFGAGSVPSALAAFISAFSSSTSRLSLARRFWNHVITCALLSDSAWAISSRSAGVRYFW